jgi:Transposase DDE domain group 1
MNLLRAGSTGRVLGHRVMAPSTLGTFLRAFTFGHVRQLDRVLDVAIKRAWQAGAGPGDGPLVIDLDSFVAEVYGYGKQGAGYGYTHVYGYHPLTAVRADTGEVLHIRNRKGQANTQRGAERFVDELLARAGRAGHAGPIVLRADSGFENHRLMRTLDQRGVEFSIAVKQSKTIRALIAEIPEEAWMSVSDYPAGGQAQVAEVPFKDWRLIVRRTRLTDHAQARLWPDWRHHAFVTNRTVPTLTADLDHRDHAEIELAIRDLKDQALAHFPSGQMHANSAWTVIAALAHNLARWSTLIGLPHRPVQTARARRRQLLSIPGRLVCTARRWTLRLPARWPWRTDFLTVLDALRTLPTRT